MADGRLNNKTKQAPTIRKIFDEIQKLNWPEFYWIFDEANFCVFGYSRCTEAMSVNPEFKKKLETKTLIQAVLCFQILIVTYQQKRSNYRNLEKIILVLKILEIRKRKNRCGFIAIFFD